MNHVFSIEMRSKEYLTTISISERPSNRVVFEGDLGRLEDLSILDDFFMELKGSNGVLRLALSEAEIKKAFEKREQVRKKEERQ